MTFSSTLAGKVMKSSAVEGLNIVRIMSFAAVFEVLPSKLDRFPTSIEAIKVSKELFYT